MMAQPSTAVVRKNAKERELEAQIVDLKAKVSELRTQVAEEREHFKESHDLIQKASEIPMAKKQQNSVILVETLDLFSITLKEMNEAARKAMALKKDGWVKGRMELVKIE